MEADRKNEIDEKKRTERIVSAARHFELHGESEMGYTNASFVSDVSAEREIGIVMVGTTLLRKENAATTAFEC